MCVRGEKTGGMRNLLGGIGTQLAPNISTILVKSQCGENGQLTVGAIELYSTRDSTVCHEDVKTVDPTNFASEYR